MSALPVIVELDLDKAAVANRDELRLMISTLEEKLKDAPQIDLPVKHHFSQGVYAREMEIPDGALLIGKIHKHKTMNTLLRGRVSVISQDGVMHLGAGDLFVSTPGAKRVIYAHEPSSWVCYHGTHETDLEKIENEFIAKDYSEVAELPQNTEETLWLGAR